MTDKTSTLKVVVDPSGAESGASRAASAIDSVGTAAKNAKKEIDGISGNLQNLVSSIQAPLNSLKSLLQTVFSIDTVMAFGNELYKVNSVVQGFTATMMVTVGSQREAAKQFEFVSEVANKYGVSIESLTKTYGKLVAAGKDSNMTMSDMHKIFEAMAMASNVLHLSTEETRLVFYALQQMVSKGNVSMEELRRQLAEKFPGAVNLASQALEVTVKELEKMVRTGALAADEMLPKFADVITKAFGPASQFAMKSLNAEMARLHNSWFLLIKTIGESGVVEAAGKAAESLATHLNDGSTGAAAFGKSLSALINQFTDWSKKITADDIAQFFTTINNLVDALLPPMKLIGMIISGWAALLGPVAKMFSDMVKAAGNADFMILAGMFTGNGQVISAWVQKKAAIEDATASIDRFAAANAKIGKINTLSGGAMGEPIDPAYGKTPQQQLTEADAAYKSSLRNIEVKSKERDAIKELAAMETYRAALLASSQDTEVPIENRTLALKTLVSQEKDYLALKKEANGEIKEGQKAYDAIYKPIENYLRKLDDETDKLTLSSAQIDALNIKIMLQGVAKKDLASVTARLTDAQEKLNGAQKYDAWKKGLEEIQKQEESYLKSLDQQIEKQQYENTTLNMSKQEIREYDIAKLEATLTTKMMSSALTDAAMVGTKEAEVTMAQVAALEKLIAAKKAGNVLNTNKDELDSSMKLQAKILSTWDRTNDSIAGSLTDALLRGFEQGKSFAEVFKAELVSMFKTLVLKPIIQPIMGEITGDIRTMLGFGMAGKKSILDPSGDGTGLFGTILNGASMWATGSKLLGAGGMAGGFVSGVQAGWAGASLPGQAGFVGPMMPGATVAPGAAAGQSVGSFAATAAPYVMALAAVMTTYDQYRKWGNDTTGKVGVLGGAAAGAAAGAVLGPVGMAVGAIIGALAGGRLFGRGATNADAFGLEGNVSGSSFKGQNWQDLSQRGGLFRSDNRWTEMSALSGDQQSGFDGIMSSYKVVFDSIGKTLGIDATKMLEGFTASFKITVKDRDPAEVQKDINDFFDKVFRDQLGLVLADQTDQLRGYVDGFTGTTAELIDFVSALATVAAAIPKMNINGLSFDNLDLMAKSGENVVQTFTRVTAGFNSINAVFKTEIAKTNESLLAIKQAFEGINVVMPQNQVEWQKLVDSIDLSTDSGRKLFDVMTMVAPAFKEIADAAISMMNTIRGQLTQVYGGQTGVTFARQNFDTAANAWNAWGAANRGWGQIDSSETLRALTAGEGADVIADITNPNSANYFGPEAAALMNQMLAAFLELRSATNASTAATNSSTTATNSAYNATLQFTESLLRARTSLADDLRGSLLSNLSPLSLEQKYTYAENNLNRLVGLAQGGDLNAYSQVSGARNDFLNFSQQRFGFSPTFNSDYFRTFDQSNALTGNAASRPQTAADMQQQTAEIITALTLNTAENNAQTGFVAQLLDLIKDGIKVNDPAVLALLQQIKNSSPTGGVVASASGVI